MKLLLNLGVKSKAQVKYRFKKDKSMTKVSQSLISKQMPETKRTYEVNKSLDTEEFPNFKELKAPVFLTNYQTKSLWAIASMI